MSEALKPCPFCGSSNLVTVEVAIGELTVLCVRCGGEGPSVHIQTNTDDGMDKAKAEAIAAWNRRAPQPDKEN